MRERQFGVMAPKIGVRVLIGTMVMLGALSWVSPAGAAAFRPCSLVSAKQVSALLGGKGKVTAQRYELPAPVQGCLYRRGTQGPPDSGHATGNSMFESVQTGVVVQAQFKGIIADAEAKVGKPLTPITYAALRRYIIHLDGTVVVHGGSQQMGPNDSAVTFWASKDGDYLTLKIEGSGDTVSTGSACSQTSSGDCRQLQPCLPSTRHLDPLRRQQAALRRPALPRPPQPRRTRQFPGSSLTNTPACTGATPSPRQSRTSQSSSSWKPSTTPHWKPRSGPIRCRPSKSRSS